MGISIGLYTGMPSSIVLYTGAAFAGGLAVVVAVGGTREVLVLVLLAACCASTVPEVDNDTSITVAERATRLPKRGLVGNVIETR